MSKGVEMIAAERKRQVDVEGWTPAHDKYNSHGELAKAAACYAVGFPIYQQYQTCLYKDERLPVIEMVHLWPWLPGCYKPKDRLADLVRAGALLAAEIDRILANGEEE